MRVTWGEEIDNSNQNKPSAAPSAKTQGVPESWARADNLLRQLHYIVLLQGGCIPLSKVKIIRI
jgi:hypothetical protein